MNKPVTWLAVLGGLIVVIGLATMQLSKPAPAPTVVLYDGATGEVSSEVSLTTTPSLEGAEEWFPLQNLNITLAEQSVQVVFDYNSSRYNLLKAQEGGAVNGIRRGLTDQAKELIPGRDLLGGAADVLRGDACTVIKATTGYAVVERCSGGDMYRVTLMDDARVDAVVFTDNSASARPNHLVMSQRTRGKKVALAFDMRR